jgi:radical SAM protein with 4Fe4S-binding SPASM domain
MRWWWQLKGLEPGTYKYDGVGEFAHHRFHLRVDGERNGALLVDASKLLFLNGTALDHVRCLLEGKSADETIGYIVGRYRKVDRERAKADNTAIANQLREFVHGNAQVLSFIGSETMVIGEDRMPSPYRMDLALTYSCQNDCAHCYNEEGAKGPGASVTDGEGRLALNLEQWKQVIAKVWEQGIPHVVFTGGEPTLVPFLRELVAESERYGQVTGIVTNGRNLAKPGYLAELVRAGLDHAQITLLSHRESVHDKLAGSQGAWRETVEGIKVAVKEDLYVSTNTTIMASNADDIADTMRFIASLGVKNIAFNGIIRAGGGKNIEGITYERLKSILQTLGAIADETGTRLIWYSPTPYCELNPVNYGLGIKQCTACSINMAVEPDGTVIPCQSYYESLGNILADPWDKIWNHELCKRLRERKYLPGKCRDCGLAQACGGGCPLSVERGDYMCMDRHSSM